MDAHKGVDSGKIQAMVTSHHFIIHHALLVGISDHCVLKTKHMACPHECIYIKAYGMDSISYTKFIRFTGYKSLLLSYHAIIALLVCRRETGGVNRGCRRERLEEEVGDKGRLLHFQGGMGGGDTYMITYSADKCPSYPVSWLFECLFFAFLNASVLSFDVITIKNEL